MPSLFTLKKRFSDLKFLFQNKKEKVVSDFELLSALPHPTTIMRKINKSWEELMEELGSDFISIKKEKVTINLKKPK